MSFAAGMAQPGREEILLAEYSTASTDSLGVETLIKYCDDFTYNQPEKALHTFVSRQLNTLKS